MQPPAALAPDAAAPPGLAPRAVIRMDTLDNPYPPSPQLVENLLHRLRELTAGLNHAPEPAAAALREQLADHLRRDGHRHLTRDHLWPTNGADAALAQILAALAGPGRTALGIEPCPAAHRRLVHACGTGWQTAARTPELTLDADTILDAVSLRRPDVTILASPNDPDGARCPAALLAALANTTGGLVVVDESYAEFDDPDAPGALDLLPEHPRLIVLRSLSASHALAGARVGYLAADPALVRAIARRTLPHQHLSTLAQAAVQAALAHSRQARTTAATIRAERDRLAAALTALGYRVAPSAAHFLLVGNLTAARAVRTQLAERDILVADVGLPGRLRVSVGTPHENQRLLDALRELTPTATGGGR